MRDRVKRSHSGKHVIARDHSGKYNVQWFHRTCHMIISLRFQLVDWRCDANLSNCAWICGMESVSCFKLLMSCWYFRLLCYCMSPDSMSLLMMMVYHAQHMSYAPYMNIFPEVCLILFSCLPFEKKKTFFWFQNSKVDKAEFGHVVNNIFVQELSPMYDLFWLTYFIMF